MVPNALLHSLKHYKVLHERVVLATVTAADTPFVAPVAPHRRGKAGQGLFLTRLVYGFFETPDIPAGLALARAHGLALELDQSTFFLGRETLVPGEHPSLQPLAGGALHVAGVERAVAGAILPPAAGARGGAGHP